MEQMGEWYLQESCTNRESKSVGIGINSTKNCCATLPIIKCHYRDKPSAIPCPDYPNMGQETMQEYAKKSFW